MDDEELAEKLAELLHRTSEDHHVAFKETDGVDPDWSIWYAGHLQEMGFDTMLGAKILKSDLIYLLGYHVIREEELYMGGSGAGPRFPGGGSTE